MTNVKIKFQLSSVTANDGELFYCITHKKEERQTSSTYHLFQEEWDSVSSEIIYPNKDPIRMSQLLKICKGINDDLCCINGIVRRFESSCMNYSAEDVINLFREDKKLHHSQDDMFFPFMENVIDHLQALARERTCETYKTALRSFKHFRQNIDLPMSEMTSEIIQLYEAYLRSKGDSPNTTSFYMRILRAVYNRAVEQKIIVNQFPFNSVYTGVAKTAKRALPIDVIRKIKHLDLSGRPKLETARDVFLLSFYLRGMSFIDLCFLKRTDMHNGRINYRRRKTDHDISIKVEEPMSDILEKYDDRDSIYLMPFISSVQGNERKQYKKAANNINRYLDAIGKELKLSIPLRFYSARHSWASIAKSKHIPLSVISEGMGHESEKTTEIYLASLDASEVDKANKLILSYIT